MSYYNLHSDTKPFLSLEKLVEVLSHFSWVGSDIVVGALINAAQAHIVMISKVDFYLLVLYLIPRGLFAFGLP